VGRPCQPGLDSCDDASGELNIQRITWYGNLMMPFRNLGSLPSPLCKISTRHLQRKDQRAERVSRNADVLTRETTAIGQLQPVPIRFVLDSASLWIQLDIQEKSERRRGRADVALDPV
jgi:hypothetical protein